MMAKLLISLIIATISITVAYQNVAANDENFDVEKNAQLLCKNKHLELTKISQVQSIIGHLKSTSDFDCSGYKESILDLEETITEDLNDVCNLEKVNQIRAYHDKYIAINSETKSSENQIPNSLRNFFLGFGIKVSYICKKNMINSLLYDPHNILTENDFKTMDLWTSKSGSMMNEIIGAPVDYDDLVLASDLNYLKSDNGPDSNEKLFIQTATGKLIRKIQMSCKRRFKPFYEKLIIPLVTLSNIGYNFQGEELERELEEMKTNKEVNEWYRVVYLCESLNDMEIIDSGDEIEAGDTQVVRILTREEVEKLRADTATSVNKEQSVEELAQVDYQFEGQVPIDDEVVDLSDKNLIKLIANFDAKKRESDRIRTKVFHKLGGFVKKVLKNKQIKFVTDFFKKKLFDKDPDESKAQSHAKEDMVYAIDEFVSLKQERLDMPVAGVMDYVKRVHHNAVYLGPKGVVKKISDAKKFWSMGRIFWYIMATIIFAIGVAIFAAAVSTG